MKLYLDARKEIDENTLHKIALGMKEGKLAIFPTETVYGIGTNALNANAVKNIYLAKKRDFKNPINLLVSNMTMVEEITQEITPLERKLMQHFFPGPFTIILKKNAMVPNIVTANSPFVGIRMPNHPLTLKLITYAGVPIAAPSANLSGTPSATLLSDISDDFHVNVDFMINGGPCSLGIESTIVRVIDDVIHILRPGMITKEDLAQISTKVIWEENSSLLPSQENPHYSFFMDSFYVEGEPSQIITKIKELASSYQNPLIVCCSEHLKDYAPFSTISMGSCSNFEQISKNIFAIIRKINKIAPEVVLIEGVPEEGLGIAIRNRFVKACHHQTIEI